MKTNTLCLSALLVLGNTMTSQAGTVLVNFVNPFDGATRTIATATAADYQTADSNVSGTAPVVELDGGNSPATNGRNPIPASTVIGEGLTINTSATNGFAFAAQDSNAIGALPILDTYIGGGAGVTIEFSITSIEEILTGTDFTLTVYAIGDAANQDGSVDITYNGVTTNIGTEADLTGSTFAQVTYTKADGVDQIDISNAGTTDFKGINGFSLTADTVPEPSSALLGLLGTLALVIRRRK